MTLDTFFKKFDQFADAPDAVAKTRELILLLAMQGRLSEKCDDDDPVQDLLCAIDREKVGVKKSNESHLLPEQGGRWPIPNRWTWVRFGRIAQHNAGKTLETGRNSGHARDYITTSNLLGFFQNWRVAPDAD